MALLNISGNTGDFIFIIILAAIAVALITLIGIWEIHKSIDNLTAAQLSNKEVLEDILEEKKEQNKINAMILQYIKEERNNNND